jgi:hypothetical protein
MIFFELGLQKSIKGFLGGGGGFLRKKSPKK